MDKKQVLSPLLYRAAARLLGSLAVVCFRASMAPQTGRSGQDPDIPVRQATAIVPWQGTSA